MSYVQYEGRILYYLGLKLLVRGYKQAPREGKESQVSTLEADECSCECSCMLWLCDRVFFVFGVLPPLL